MQNDQKQKLNPFILDSSPLDNVFFDWQIILTTLRLKIKNIIFITLLVSITIYLLSKIMVQTQWQARTLIIRHKKNVALQTKIPYINQEMDLRTVYETMKLRSNLQELINVHGLNLSTNQLMRRINITKDKRSNIIHILVKDHNRFKAAELANSLAEIFITNYAPILNASLAKISDKYQRRKAEIVTKLHKYENALDQFSKMHNVASFPSELKVKYDKLKQLEISAVDCKVDESNLVQKIYEYKEKIISLPDRVKHSSMLIQTNARDLKELKRELSVLSKTYTHKNPKIIRQKQKIRALEELIKINKTSNSDEIPDRVTFSKNGLKDSMRLELMRIEGDFAGLKKKTQDYEHNIKELKDEIQVLKSKERKFYFLQRNVDIYKNILNDLEGKLVETNLASEANEGEFEILETATPPLTPMRSHRKLITFISAFFTFFLTLAYYFIREVLDNSVKSPFDFKKYININYLASLPDKNQINETTYYNQLQIIYHHLSSYQPNKKPILFAIGSDIINSGKSFLIQEIIELFLLKNKKVLYIKSIAQFEDHLLPPFCINAMLFHPKKNMTLNAKHITPHYALSFFVKDLNILKTPLNDENIKSFLHTAKDFDYIFWELPEFSFDVQLSINIATYVDLMLVITRFKKSKTPSLTKTIELFFDKNVQNISGIINIVDRPYLQLSY
jgi:uncharacterized protein involved in exopolysaccharide biosynthesis